METVLTLLFSVPVVFCVSAYMCFTTGFVLSTLWAWFMVPRGLPPVDWKTFVVAVSMFRLALPALPTLEDKRSSKDKLAAGAGAMIAPWSLLLMGWLLK